MIIIEAGLRSGLPSPIQEPRSDILPPWRKSNCAGSNGSGRPQVLAVPGMICIKPCAFCLAGPPADRQRLSCIATALSKSGSMFHSWSWPVGISAHRAPEGPVWSAFNPPSPERSVVAATIVSGQFKRRLFFILAAGQWSPEAKPGRHADRLVQFLVVGRSRLYRAPDLRLFLRRIHIPDETTRVGEDRRHRRDVPDTRSGLVRVSDRRLYSGSPCPCRCEVASLAGAESSVSGAFVFVSLHLVAHVRG